MCSCTYLVQAIVLSRNYTHTEGWQHYLFTVSKLPYENAREEEEHRDLSNGAMRCRCRECMVKARSHLVPVSQLKRAEESADGLYLENEWIMTEEIRNQDTRQENKQIRGSDKAVNLRQVV